MATYGPIDYQQTLLNASKSMIRVKDPITLLRLITRFIDRQIGATHVGILLYEKPRNAYVLIDSKGEMGRRIPVGYIRIPGDDPIVQYFKGKHTNGSFNRKEALVYQELEHIQNFEMLVKKQEHYAVLIDEIKKQMELFRSSVCVPSFYKHELIAILVLGDKLTGEAYMEDELSLFVTLANDVAMAVKNAELIKDLTVAYDKEHQLLIETASALVGTIEARDKYTKGHSERVSYYSLRIAAELAQKKDVNHKREFLEVAQLGGLLHDIGKIGIKDTILNKPARLSENEYATMKTHVKIGANILKPITSLRGLHDGVLYHHERWDGKGYPYGLKGAEIPIVARIICVVDAFDTMVTTRPYAKSLSTIEALEELKRCAGTQFDAEVVTVFYDLIRTGRITKRDLASYGLMNKPETLH